MPVIDLADYLGMPAQAPANPVFNQTRKSTGVASLDREVDDFYKGAAAIDQLRSLQRLAPVFEAQKAQLAYDKVAQDARDLRMKQEIEAQVERAASELAGGNLNPESEDFGAKYRDLATRNPLAFSDPRFSNVAGLYAAQNQNYQAARKQKMDAERAAAAKADEELRTAIGGFLEYGGDANLVPSIKSVQQAKYLEGQMRKAAREAVGTRGGAKDVAGQAKQKDFELVSSEIDKMEKLGKSVLYDKDGAEIPNPKFDKLVEEYDRLFNKLRGSYQGIYSPAQTPAVQPTTQQQVSPAAAAARSALTGMASVATPFSPAALPASAIVSALPQTTVPQPTPEREVIIDINDPSADENTYMAAISDSGTSLNKKENALNKLREYVNNPKPKTFADFTEGLQYAEKLENNLKDAEMQFSMEKDRSVANPVWDNVKSVMDSKIKEVAKKLNMTTDTLLNSLIKNEVLSGDKVGPEIVAKYGNVRSNEVPTRNIFKALSQVDWRNKIPSFEPLKKLPNAYNLGLSSGKTWNDVFESYIDEKKSKPVATSTKESPTGMPLTEQQQKDLDDLKTLAGSK